MTNTAKNLFVTGLQNAHAMETQARQMMERQSARLSDYPEIKQRIQSHLFETKQQLNRLEECLRMSGGSPSTFKDATQSLMGNMMAMAHAAAGDEILKNMFANNAFENYEIAAYKSLLTMCGPAGAENCKLLLETSLKEEEEMAQWIASMVAKVTAMYMQRAVKSAA